jgi:phosphoribosyl 1,2-cyclic phosphate phosphodiesterase
MSNKGHLLFLGTGGSLGIPVVGCSCHVCQSPTPYNKRLRPSALLEVEGKRYLIDCGPDFRTQALTHHIDNLDGVFLTHSHHDHSCGIDDLRIFTFKRGVSLPCLMSPETYSDLLKRFYYIFDDKNIETKYTTNFSSIFLHGPEGAINFNGLKISYCSYYQGGMKVNGFRLGDMAFLTDVKNYDDTVFDFLSGVHTLVVSALRFTPSPLHLSMDEAIEFVKKSGAKEAWFTHIAHELEHEAGNAYLPPYIRLAHDGLRISFTPEKADLYAQ